MKLIRIAISPTLNVGCTKCGRQAVVALSYDTDNVLEIVATACAEHDTEPCPRCEYEDCKCELDYLNADSLRTLPDVEPR